MLERFLSSLVRLGYRYTPSRAVVADRPTPREVTSAATALQSPHFRVEKRAKRAVYTAHPPTDLAQTTQAPQNLSLFPLVARLIFYEFSWLPPKRAKKSVYRSGLKQ